MEWMHPCIHINLVAGCHQSISIPASTSFLVARMPPVHKQPCIHNTLRQRKGMEWMHPCIHIFLMAGCHQSISIPASTSYLVARMPSVHKHPCFHIFRVARMPPVHKQKKQVAKLPVVIYMVKLLH